jgi:ADP-ribose pyrophosphatase YjhB (NUDIX family)
MASLGPGIYVVVVVPIGGSKASDIKLVLQREPFTRKTWFLAGLILPNEAPVDASVRELFWEVGLTLTVDDLTWLSGNHIRVSLPASQHQLVHVFLASVHIPYAAADLRTPAKVEQAVTDHSNFHRDGSYVNPNTVDIDGLSLTPSKIGLVKETQRKFGLLQLSPIGIFSRRCNFPTTLSS